MPREKKENKTYFVLNLLMIALMLAVVVIMAISFVHRLTTPPIDATVNTGKGEKAKKAIQLNILNGCGVKGTAQITKEFLHSLGFDVVEIGNSNELIDKSIVIDRVGDKLSAQKLAIAMGIADSCIISSIDSTLFLRSTVILGKDYKELKPFR